MRKDATDTIMKTVIRYERRRTAAWIMAFIVIVGMCIAGAVFMGERAVTLLSEWQVFDLLTLFNQDREIVFEFWQDTLSIAWAQAPRRYILGGIVSALIAVYIWIRTRKKRKVVTKRAVKLAKRAMGM